MMVRWPPPGCRIIVIFPVNKPMAGFFVPTCLGSPLRASRRYAVIVRGERSGQSFRLIPISVRLAPPIFVDDISESDTADGSEPSHRVANQQQGIGMDAGRQSERGLRFPSRTANTAYQSRAEVEGSSRQEHILHRWVDGRLLDRRAQIPKIIN